MATDFTKCEQCGADIDEGEWFCSQKCYEDNQADIEDMENNQRDEEQEILEAEFAWYCTQSLGLGESQSESQKILEADFMSLQNKIIMRRENGLCA
jgi:predicted nucleic acid-binding Zn ribbon protein